MFYSKGVVKTATYIAILKADDEIKVRRTIFTIKTLTGSKYNTSPESHSFWFVFY